MEVVKELDTYISRLEDAKTQSDDQIESLIEEVTRVVFDMNDLATLVLDYYRAENPDLQSDIVKLIAKLKYTRAELLDQEEKSKRKETIEREQREIEKLRLKVELSKSSITIQNNNHIENSNSMSVSFEYVRKQVENMTSLPEDQIEEIMEKINEIEAIVKSTESKSKKWSKAKEIIKWIADKGVDVGISLLPLLLQIG